jgi:hypothetical protein
LDLGLALGLGLGLALGNDCEFGLSLQEKLFESWLTQQDPC